MSHTLSDSKQALRRRMLDARGALPLALRQASATAVGERVAAIGAEIVRVVAGEGPAPRTVTLLTYAAHGSELDPEPAVAALRAHLLREFGDSAELVVAFPRVADDDGAPQATAAADTCAASLLRIHVCDALDLVAGFRGIREPSPGEPEIDPGHVDIVLVPGVAFGRDGFRLGYGRGYYDRLLAAAPRAVAVGLAYDETLVDEVPHEDHDRSLDYVVTPSVVLAFSRTTGR